MAQLDFPSSPTTGQTFTGPNGVIWQWDGGLARVPELPVVFAGGRAVGGVGFLGAIECPDMDCTAGAEPGAEATGAAGLYAFGEKARPPLVLHVLRMRGRAQIDPAVVVPDAIDVIDLWRFLAADHLEDDAVAGPEDVIELDERVASVVVVPGDVSRVPSVPPFPLPKAAEVFWGADLPSQYPACRLVTEAHLQVATVRQNPVEVWHA